MVSRGIVQKKERHLHSDGGALVMQRRKAQHGTGWTCEPVNSERYKRAQRERTRPLFDFTNSIHYVCSHQIGV